MEHSMHRGIGNYSSSDRKEHKITYISFDYTLPNAGLSIFAQISLMDKVFEGRIWLDNMNIKRIYPIFKVAYEEAIAFESMLVLQREQRKLSKLTELSNPIYWQG